MFVYILQNPIVLALPAMLIICALAILKGGPAERHTAMFFLGGNVVLLALDWVSSDRELITNVSLAGDAMLALAFLWLAMRHRSLWLAAAMMAQGAAFAIHVYVLESQDGQISAAAYQTFAIGMNFMSWTVMLLILGGTVATLRKRSKAKARQPMIPRVGEPLAQ